MMKFVRFFSFLACLLSAGAAWASGGSCPTAANYLNPSNPNGPLVTLSSLGVTSCYFISKSTGSDSNAGTSESSPLEHLPGMASYSGKIAPSAGEGFILEGCDVWVNSDLPVNWNGWSGSSGSPIYVGVDETWYNTTNCPSAWNRPVFNAQKTAISGSSDYVINPIYGADPSYVTFDSIEFTEVEVSTTTNSGVLQLWGQTSKNDTFTRNYIHAMDATADGSGSASCVLVNGPYEATTATGFLYAYNVIDGSDRTGSGNTGSNGVCYGFYTNYSNSKILYNVIQYVVNPIVAYASSSSDTLEIGGNLIAYGLDSLGGINHCNLIETVGSGTYYIHDNVMHDLECSGGENMMIGNTGETDYVWNNIIYNMGSSQSPSGPQNAGQTGISLYFWNNTIVDARGTGCFFYSGQGGDQYSVINFQNNHCISSASSALGSGFNVTTLTNANNLLQTASTADADTSPRYDQYTSSQFYVFSPVESTNSTVVGTGTNLTGSWPAGFSTNATNYACSEGSVNGVSESVCATGAMALARVSTGAWNVGAYQFGPGPSSPLNLTGQVTAVGQ